MRRTGEILRVQVHEAVLVILGPTVSTIGAYSPGIGPSAYPISQDSRISIEGDGFLVDDVLYTIQLSAPTPLAVTRGHQPLDLFWVRHDTHYIATTTLQFRQVGWTEFRMGDGGLRLKIQSRKMDYETDYQRMVRDLENQVRGLTAKLISSVLNPMAVTQEPFDLWSYWLALLEQLWSDLSRDVAVAWRTLAPHLRTETITVFMDRQRKVDAHDLRTSMQRGHTRIPSRVRQWDVVTPERVYLLQLLQYLHQRLQRIFHRVSDVDLDGRLAGIDRQVTQLFRKFAQETGTERVVGEPQIPTSPVAESHPALRRVVHWHRLLRMGLFPDGDSYLVGPKDISLLYEYWCYLTIVRMVLEESQGELKVSPVASVNPVDILLSSGKDNAAEIRLPTGRCIQVLYERQFQGLPTVTQQPDHVVQLQGMDSLVVFDAKYRFELEERVLENYGKGTPIPPVDTINGMHQYHDAIVMRDTPYRRLVDRAIVLFPLPNQYVGIWPQHRFYKSINAVGVGALPLLPGGEDMLLRQEIRRYVEAIE